VPVIQRDEFQRANHKLLEYLQIIGDKLSNISCHCSGKLTAV